MTETDDSVATYLKSISEDNSIEVVYTFSWFHFESYFSMYTKNSAEEVKTILT